MNFGALIGIALFCAGNVALVHGAGTEESALNPHGNMILILLTFAILFGLFYLFHSKKMEKAIFKIELANLLVQDSIKTWEIEKLKYEILLTEKNNIEKKYQNLLREKDAALAEKTELTKSLTELTEKLRIAEREKEELQRQCERNAATPTQRAPSNLRNGESPVPEGVSISGVVFRSLSERNMITIHFFEQSFTKIPYTDEQIDEQIKILNQWHNDQNYMDPLDLDFATLAYLNHLKIAKPVSKETVYQLARSMLSRTFNNKFLAVAQLEATKFNRLMQDSGCKIRVFMNHTYEKRYRIIRNLLAGNPDKDIERTTSYLQPGTSARANASLDVKICTPRETPWWQNLICNVIRLHDIITKLMFLRSPVHREQMRYWITCYDQDEGNNLAMSNQI